MKNKIKQWLESNVDKGFKVPWTFVLIGFFTYAVLLSIFLFIFFRLLPSNTIEPVTTSVFPTLSNPLNININAPSGSGGEKTLILSLLTATMTFLGGLIGLFYLGVKVQERHEYFRDYAEKQRNDVRNEIVEALKILGSNSTEMRLYAVSILFEIVRYRKDPKVTQDVFVILCDWIRHSGQTENSHINNTEVINEKAKNNSDKKAVREKIVSGIIALYNEFGSYKNSFLDGLDLYLCGVDIDQEILFKGVTFKNFYVVDSLLPKGIRLVDCRFSEQLVLTLKMKSKSLHGAKLVGCALPNNGTHIDYDYVGCVSKDDRKVGVIVGGKEYPTPFTGI